MPSVSDANEWWDTVDHKTMIPCGIGNTGYSLLSFLWCGCVDDLKS